MKCLMNRLWFFLLVFLLAHTSANASALSCTSFGSVETFQLHIPTGQGEMLGLQIWDTLSYSPQKLVLQGKVSMTGFKVKASRTSYRSGKLDLGILMGQQQSPQQWTLNWQPVGTTANGSTELDFVCIE